MSGEALHGVRDIQDRVLLNRSRGAADERRMRVLLFIVGLFALSAAVRGFAGIGAMYRAVVADPNNVRLQGELFGYVMFGIVLLAVAYKCFFPTRREGQKPS